MFSFLGRDSVHLFQSYFTLKQSHDDFNTLLKRLGIDQTLLRSADFCGENVIKLSINERIMDLIFAVCNYIKEQSSESDIPLRTVYTLLASAPTWTFCPNVSARELIVKLTTSLFAGIFNLKSTEGKLNGIKKALEIVTVWCSLIDSSDTQNILEIRNYCEAFLSTIPSICTQIGKNFAEEMICGLLKVIDGTTFDLRLLLSDAPREVGLDDVVSNHYLSTRHVFLSLMEFNLECLDPSIKSKVRTICQDYFDNLLAFLLNTISDEPFLCQITALLLTLMMRFSFIDGSCSESVISALQAFQQFKKPSNFASLFLPLSLAYLDSSRKILTNAFTLITVVKGILFTLCMSPPDYPDPKRTMTEGGEILGKLVEILLPTERIFCESLVANLIVEFPQDSATFGEAVNENGVLVLGCIATTVKDDSISRICISTFLTQFNKIPATNTLGRDPYLSQFASMAGACGGGVFNTILDTLMGLLKKGIQPLQTLLYLSNISHLVSKDSIKRDVLLISLMRCFIERGVSTISEEKSKDTRKSFVDLDLLLKAACTCFNSFSQNEFWQGRSYIEVFQEFWLVLVALGYQQELKWRAEWAEYIPVIARSTPVLIKSRDRLQSPGSTFSQVVLSRSINPGLRSHLGSFLLPNSFHLLRDISLAQCLWLIAIYFAEYHKLIAGVYSHLPMYLKSEVIEILGIYPLVEDLCSTLIGRWKKEVSADGPAKIQLARILMENLCHILPQTHETCRLLLERHFVDDFMVYTDKAIWETIACKMSTMYFICRSDMGSAELDCLPENYTRDPTAARKAFTDTINIGRQIFEKAAQQTPNHYFRFAHSKINSQVGLGCIQRGDRDVAMLELLRIVFSSNNIPSIQPISYLQVDSLLYRNPEDFVHHESIITVKDKEQFVLSKLTGFEDPDGVRTGVRTWLLLADTKPTISVELLKALCVELPLAIVKHFPQTWSHPLRDKLSPSPSHIEDRQMESNLIVSLSIVLDYLSEQLRYDRIHSSHLIPIYFSLVRRMLELLPLHVHRFVGFRVMLFAHEVLKNGKDVCKLFELVYEHLYQRMIVFFSSTESLKLSPNSCIKEELAIIKGLIGFITEDRESSTPSSSKGKEVQGMLATSFLVLLQQHLNDALIWLDEELPKKSKSFEQYDTKKNLVASISSYSFGLASRLSQIYKQQQLPKVMFQSSIINCAYELINSSELLTMALENDIEISLPIMILSSPVLLPSAIRLFAKETIPKKLNLAMRSLEESPAEALFFYIPQLVQTLRHDLSGFIERSILHVAKQSSLFAHQIVWNMRANSFLDEAATIPDSLKPTLDLLVEKITKQFSGESLTFYNREFSFFEKVTNISGSLKPYVKREKWEKKAKIDEELAKIKVDPGVYLPSNPECTVLDIDYESGRPLQSHAKAPFMATFKVRPTMGEGATSWQAAIFKVGDDCRQDVLALQMISLLKELASHHRIPVYFFPYRVVATAPGCGVIEVIPKSISRDLLGREKINSLYEYFIFRFGGESTKAFHDARINFVRSMAAYSIICYLLAIKDRHNGNIMIDEAGHIIHIDFGFILDIAPGGISFEKAPFKLTSEMLQVMGGKEVMRPDGTGSPYFTWFCELCVQLFLVARLYAESFVQLVESMKESGLPCFKGGDKTIRNLRNRFRLDLSVGEAREFMYSLVSKSCENVSTSIYDRFQLSTNGIPY